MTSVTVRCAVAAKSAHKTWRKPFSEAIFLSVCHRSACNALAITPAAITDFVARTPLWFPCCVACSTAQHPSISNTVHGWSKFADERNTRTDESEGVTTQQHTSNEVAFCM